MHYACDYVVGGTLHKDKLIISTFIDTFINYSCHATLDETKRRGHVVNIPASYSGSPGLKFRSTDRLS
jgi:hypothetical protein